MKIWNLIYTKVDADDCMAETTRVRSFPSEKEAEEAMAAEYEDTLADERADSVLDVIAHCNYGNNAVIKMGYDAKEDWQTPEVETVFRWRIAMQTVDAEGDGGAVWVVTASGTSSGEYEGDAHAMLFGDYESAMSYVEECLDEQVDLTFATSGATKEEVAKWREETCTWWGDRSARFLYHDARADYRIEKVKLPR